MSSVSDTSSSSELLLLLFTLQERCMVAWDSCSRQEAAGAACRRWRERVRPQVNRSCAREGLCEHTSSPRAIWDKRPQGLEDTLHASI